MHGRDLLRKPCPCDTPYSGGMTLEQQVAWSARAAEIVNAPAFAALAPGVQLELRKELTRAGSALDLPAWIRAILEKIGLAP